jgi:thymidylate synthase ThyX
MKKTVTLLTTEPTIAVLAEQRLNNDGLRDMARWVRSHRPECLPDDFHEADVRTLFPHADACSDNELLVEIAGRKCYDSFGLKAGRKSNAEYIAHTQMLTNPRLVARDIVGGSTKGGSAGLVEAEDKIEAALQEERNRVPHGSILYHAKMTFFIAGLSRRVSHELIRNYVGADRDEEGAPSQESTRFTHHYGYYVAPPRDLDDDVEMAHFRADMQDNYDSYLGYIERQFGKHGGDPKGIVRKRIYEAASARLSHACETSFVWTTNPGALTKLFVERDSEAADAEFRRFARAWKRVCLERWPNLFPRFRREAL